MAQGLKITRSHDHYFIFFFFLVIIRARNTQLSSKNVTNQLMFLPLQPKVDRGYVFTLVCLSVCEQDLKTFMDGFK